MSIQESYEVTVGDLRVHIDFEAEAVYVDRVSALRASVVTEELDSGLLLDRDANDRTRIVGVEIIGGIAS